LVRVSQPPYKSCTLIFDYQRLENPHETRIKRILSLMLSVTLLVQAAFDSGQLPRWEHPLWQLHGVKSLSAQPIDQFLTRLLRLYSYISAGNRAPYWSDSIIIPLGSSIITMSWLSAYTDTARLIGLIRLGYSSWRVYHEPRPLVLCVVLYHTLAMHL
jgi:hypothetical protein